MKQEKKIILASASPSRAMILKDADILFDAVPADLNESRLIAESLKNGMGPAEIGITLAKVKAAVVSGKAGYEDKVVLGADQILLCGDEIFEKPVNMRGARETLKKLRGKTHTLLACVAIYKDAKQVFETTDKAHLTMRAFSDDFLESYLQGTGEKILSSAGAYQLEAEGAHLFEKIEGDFFTILGLPLLPVLGFLRQSGILER